MLGQDFLLLYHGDVYDATGTTVQEIATPTFVGAGCKGRCHENIQPV